MLVSPHSLTHSLSCEDHISPHTGEDPLQLLLPWNIHLGSWQQQQPNMSAPPSSSSSLQRRHIPVPVLLLLLLVGSGYPSVLRPGAGGGAEAKVRARSRVRTGAGAEARLGAAESPIEIVIGSEVEEWTGAGVLSGSTLSHGGGGGQWDPRGSSRCVPVPSGMALCQDIGYDTMRMPNLLGHESPGEAVQQSASWLPLLARECHPDARIFLCSLFAPICLDRFVSPCRSICEAVRDSCAPIMSCYGYPWPDILRCDQFPADHLMCISSITNASVSVSARGHKVPQASCRDCELEEASSAKDLLETFCRSDFVVKLRLTRLQSSQVSLTQFTLASRLEVLKHGPLLGGQIRSRMQLWLERDATCVRNMTRRQPRGGTFLVTGTMQGERLVVNKAFAWHKRDRNLMVAARKWKRHRCRN
ncbi:secreted frizzled-related protein 5 [Hypomesus transpacificus]|uniref:secreted frizzled-related protein 5 n=1 Tax=Hypomesus transpacificus TaxID=137520 RepID=UPI001F0774EB|nr:secreted frizzled-related protein 5 [Hypomesus transpacificus]